MTTHEYEQRLDEIADAFAGLYGEVTYGHVESASGRSRMLSVEVAVPGYGLSPIATMVLVEKHERSDVAWERSEYLYDVHMEPRPSGRYAYHWHDDVPHRHCAEVAKPGAAHHFEGMAFDDIGWAARQLFEMVSRGISCAGLRPIRAEVEEP